MNATEAATVRKGQTVVWRGETFLVVNPPRVHPMTGALVARITSATPHGGFWVAVEELAK